MEIVASYLNPWPNASEGAKAISYQHPASEMNHFAGAKSGNSDRLEAGSFYSITPLLFAQSDRLNLNFQ